MSTKLFTVIVPIHNAVNNLSEMTKWLDEIAEELIPVSVVVVADSCDDKTIELLVDLRKKYSFELVSCEFNSPGEARNLGLKFVDTEWVVFWDSDDIGCPVNIQLAIRASSESHQAIIGTYETVDRETSLTTRTSRKVGGLFEVGVDPGLWRMIFRIKRIEGHKFIATKMGEDQYFLASVNLDKKEVMCSDLVLYKYFNGSSEQLTKDKSAIGTLGQTINEFRALLSTRKFKFNDYVYVIYCRLLMTALKNKVVKPSQSIKDLRKFSIEGKVKIVKGMFYFVKVLLITGKRRATKVTTVIMTGGLGNQLFQLAAALHLTKGMINLEVDVLKPRKTEGALDLTAFSLPSRVRIKASTGRSHTLATKTAGYLLRSGIHPSRFEEMGPIREALRFLGGIVIRFYVGAGRNLYIGHGAGYTESVPADGSTLIGYFQSFRYVDNLEVQRNLMALRPKNLSAKAQNLVSEARLLNPIVVHYRLTDYTSETRFGLPNENYYRNAIEALIGVMKSPIWVFSDDMDLAKARFPGDRIEQAVFIDTEGLIPAEILHVMRHGKDYVIANSSFSWWAATLRFDRSARVIAPQPWFLGQEEPKDLIFSNWGRMEMSKT